MCTVCGCGQGQVRIGGVAGPVKKTAAPGRAASLGFRPVGQASSPTEVSQSFARAEPVEAQPGYTPCDKLSANGTGSQAHHLHYGEGPARAHAPGLSQARMVRIEQDILGHNDRLAADNRARLAELGVFAVNLVSSPGSGKTTLLVSTLEALAGELPAAVIEGDQQTEFDAERIRATGVPAIQINTGKGCHLDAQMVGQALERLPLAPGSLLLIENVGNLVCPAAFDLGEAHKVVILSVTEGEDKPLKYPDMFAAADLMLLTKTDLLPHLRFDVARAEDYARRVNPNLRILHCSASTGEGLESWLDWLRAGVERSRGA